MLNERDTRLLCVVLSLCLAACLVACKGGKNKKKKTDCIACEAGGVRCWGTFGYEDICAPDNTLAAITCSEGDGTWMVLPLCPLEPPKTGDDTETGDGTETSDGTGSEPSDLGSSVVFDRATGEYVIDRVAFEQLKLDPTPLLEDSSQLLELDSGYFEVVKTGEVAAALGWLEGDILLAVDGYALRGLDGLAVAYADLSDNTEFALTIRRGRVEIVLQYRVE